MLMDEPLASLDDARKAEILPYIERLRDEGGIPIVYVSHSVAEVARLATDVVVLAAGRVAASGPAAEVLARLDLLREERTATRPGRWSISSWSAQDEPIRAQRAALRAAATGGCRGSRRRSAPGCARGSGRAT